MLKGKGHALTNAAGLLDARKLIDATMDEYFASAFTVEYVGMTVVTNGRHQVQSIAGEINNDELVAAIRKAWDEANHDLMVRLARVRNAIQKKHRIDISKDMPEVAEAVAYMDARQAA